MRQCLREITTSRVLRRLDFYRLEAPETLVRTFILAGSQVFYCLGQSTMELGVESL
ncbi:MAG: hypothetical protein P8L78_05045 [Mariniblastus sp.]|nr:hypothetical protein [Mariniblastus sp.]